MTSAAEIRPAGRPPVSAILVVRDEVASIERCLDSLGWVDEVVVLDSGSRDGTQEICRRRGCRVIETPWRGFGAMKKLAAESATHDWIFSIDADEVVSAPLRDRLLRILEHGPEVHGYRVRFRTYYLGREIRHCGWANEHHLRFFDRRFGNYTDRPLHEAVQMEDPKLELGEAIEHFTYPTVASHLEKINAYSDLAAARLFEQGRRISLLGAGMRGVLKFFTMYVAQRGFLDGKEGLILSSISAFGVYCKYLKLWELSRWKRSS